MPKSIILTEGVADDAFINNLISARALTNVEVIRPTRSVESYGSGGFKSRLRGLKFKAVEKRPAVIVVADNDDNPSASFATIQDQIRDAGDYDVPVQPYSLSNRGKLPPVAVLMLPANGLCGSLDTLCISAVNSITYATQLSCVEALVRCLSADATTWGSTKLGKLKVQCLLSSICKGDPYTPLKSAWMIETSKGRNGDIFPLTNPIFDDVTNFLRALPL